MFSHSVLSLIGIAVIAVVAVLIYRNNQKKADQIITKVEDTAGKVAGDVKSVASDIAKKA